MQMEKEVSSGCWHGVSRRHGVSRTVASLNSAWISVAAVEHFQPISQDGRYQYAGERSHFSVSGESHDHSG